MKNVTSSVTLDVLLFLFASILLFGTRFDISKSIWNGSQSDATASSLEIWFDQLKDRPVHSSDRYALGEMGFRTRTYARLLNEHRWDQAEVLEELLWGLIPGAHDLRLAIFDDHTGKGLAEKVWHSFISKSTPSTATATATATGIVMSFHSSSFQQALHALQSLSVIASNRLPIQIFYFGSDDLPQEIRQLLLESVPLLRLFFVDVLEEDQLDSDRMGLEENPNVSIAIRQACSLLLTTFEDVVWISHDSIVLSDVTHIFSQSGYRESGTYFFPKASSRPDAVSNTSLYLASYLDSQSDDFKPSPILASSPFWHYLSSGLIDSGLVALRRTKSHVFSALLFNSWMHSRDMQKGPWSSNITSGLNETLWMTFELSGFPYYVQQSYPGAAGEFDFDLVKEEDEEEEDDDEEDEDNRAAWDRRLSKRTLDIFLKLPTMRPLNYSSPLHFFEAGNQRWPAWLSGRHSESTFNAYTTHALFEASNETNSQTSTVWSSSILPIRLLDQQSKQTFTHCNSSK